MGDAPCSGANNQIGCKIHEAKVAANNFVDLLLTGSTIRKVGVAPFTGCYNPPLVSTQCVPAPAPGNNLTPANCDAPGTSQVACLNTNAAYLHNLINAIQPNGETSICLALREAQKILNGPGNQLADPNTKRFVVLLTDGDNEFSVATSASLDPVCAPTPSVSGSDTCSSPRSASNRSLDLETLQLATQMKEDTTIYTIQISPSNCIAPSVVYTPAQCNGQVGNADPPRIASARLLQCVASSNPGTNDHYFSTSDPNSLVDISDLLGDAITP